MSRSLWVAFSGLGLYHNFKSSLIKMTKKGEDNLSLKKWLKGFLSVKNIAKAIVFGLLFMGVQYIAGAVWNRAVPHKSESKIESNAGTINQHDSHATTSVVHNHFPLSDIFSNILSFGAKNKVESD